MIDHINWSLKMYLSFKIPHLTQRVDRTSKHNFLFTKTGCENFQKTESLPAQEVHHRTFLMIEILERDQLHSRFDLVILSLYLHCHMISSMFIGIRWRNVAHLVVQKYSEEMIRYNQISVKLFIISNSHIFLNFGLVCDYTHTVAYYFCLGSNLGV